MTVDLIQAELRHTLELSAALGRRSETLRPHCSRVSAKVLSLMTTFTAQPVPADRIRPALTGIRTMNQRLAKAAAELDPDSQETIERDLAGILPTLEEFQRGLPQKPPERS